jgi:hypothetical protein
MLILFIYIIYIHYLYNIINVNYPALCLDVSTGGDRLFDTDFG